MEKILFTLDSGETAAFYILEQTKINGMQYILVTETPEEEDGEALIMKEIPGESAEGKAFGRDEESIYEIVGDDTELSAVATVFANLLEDIEFVDEE